MNRFYLGVDVGATKSHVLLSDPEGETIAFGYSGTGNPDWVGEVGFTKAIDEALQRATRETGIERSQIACAGFGVAGYDWPSQREKMMRAIMDLNLNCMIDLANDSIIALLTGSTKGWGIAVVAGTSCNAWGISPDGKMGRMCGYSQLGEYAGSHELVEEAIKAVAKSWTKRAPRTKLTQAFMDNFGAINEEDLIEGIALKKYDIGPLNAPLVFDVANAGDAVAQKLVEWAGEELGDLAVGVIRQLDLFDCEVEVVLSGSFFKGSQILKQKVEEVVKQIAPKAIIISSMTPSVVGGVLLGMKALDASKKEQMRLRKTLVDYFKTQEMM